jgi:branched-subunit amino acid aminotransferase/4-amino-4-deoxychorismate lyase
MPQDRIELNGAPASSDDLAFLAQINYGHFTSMQVRERGARGFGLHLQRLERSTRELFGSELDIGRTREYIRRLLVDDASVSLRVTVFSRGFDRTHPERTVEPDVLVATSAAREPASTPIRMRSVVHERVLPHVKHVGTFGLFHCIREARLAGYDDALFTTVAGEVSEGSITNIGFWNGTGVVWPNAPALPGITQQLLEVGLRARGITCGSRRIHLDDLGEFRSAFLMNSGSAGQSVAQIDEVRFAVDPELGSLLADCYQAQPLERI